MLTEEIGSILLVLDFIKPLEMPNSFLLTAVIIVFILRILTYIKFSIDKSIATIVNSDNSSSDTSLKF